MLDRKHGQRNFAKKVHSPLCWSEAKEVLRKEEHKMKEKERERVRERERE